jgi:hypothetical protein
MFPFIFANQIQDLGEDCKNKPSSPMPAVHISVDSAADMRWVMVTVCLMLSSGATLKLY